ncbi:hypothetical protein SVA_1385 [Sulfurifustis variabilis]|uniref:Uncharacterized protein n=1 Tax=Sulfurifustis variabilis TaxID=1675686 RepID=A0A1B4V315_9GAMM|nr:hypothetical protein [Sulfurifustis variabilis]BAU47950.1 hypothetical protein SVA_1385 [Sulfurifustis variabilis]
MRDYTSEQIDRIRNAVAEARAALRTRRRYDPLEFARVYVAHDGVQIPGEPPDSPARIRLAEALLEALAEGRDAAGNPGLSHELERVRTETRWAEAEESDDIVGFRLELPPAALLERPCRQLLKLDRGLGPAVFPKTQVVVLAPACGGARFVPVREHEIEQ